MSEEPAARRRRILDRARHAGRVEVTELARVYPLEAVPLPPTAWWHDVDTPEDLRAVSNRPTHKSCSSGTSGAIAPGAPKTAPAEEAKPVT